MVWMNAKKNLKHETHMGENPLKKVQHPYSSGECKPKLLGYFLLPLSDGVRSIKQRTIHAFKDIAKMEHFFHYRWEYKLVHTLWKSLWEFLRKVEAHVYISPAYSQKTLMLLPTYLLVHVHYWSIFNTLRKEPRCPLTDEYIMKMWLISMIFLYQKINCEVYI